jgi:hypothetical protein
MKKRVLLGLVWSLAVSVALNGATRQSPVRAAGHWEGTIDTPGQKLDIVVDLAGRSGGTSSRYRGKQSCFATTLRAGLEAGRRKGRGLEKAL